MYGFKSAVDRCHDDFLSWVAITPQQIEASGQIAAEAPEKPGLEAKDLGLARAFPVPTDSLDLARHVNEFLSARQDL